MLPKPGRPLSRPRTWLPIARAVARQQQALQTFVQFHFPVSEQWSRLRPPRRAAFVIAVTFDCGESLYGVKNESEAARVRCTAGRGGECGPLSVWSWGFALVPTENV